MQLFYSKDIAEGLCTLDVEESRHAVKALRVRAGDDLQVTDGKGGLYDCVVVSPDAKECVVEVRNAYRLPAPQYGLHLVVAPTKNPSRMEWLVEKAVEMGVEEIVLVRCDHSERVSQNVERLERIAVSAMKQSLRLFLPKVSGVVEIGDWMASLDGAASDGIRLIAHCQQGAPREPLVKMLATGRDAWVLIGPEGDFSPREVAAAMDCGFRPVTFGDARMRTETAALYIAASFHFINQDLI